MMSQDCDLKDGNGEQWEKAREHFRKAVDGEEFFMGGGCGGFY